MARRVLLLTGDAGESYETLYARHRFLEAGFQPDVAAPSKRRLHLVMHDFAEGWDTYFERPGYELDADLTFAAVKPESYEAVLALGGRAPEYLRNDPEVIDLVRAFHTAGKWVFSICHGIQILVAAGVIEGKKIACYEHCRYEAESAGAKWLADQAVRDGKVITGQTWLSHPEFYRLVFEALG